MNPNAYTQPLSIKNVNKLIKQGLLPQKYSNELLKLKNNTSYLDFSLIQFYNNGHSYKTFINDNNKIELKTNYNKYLNSIKNAL